jgi:hypothetical protein
MITARAILWIIGFMGCIYALIGLFEGLPQVGLGMAVAATSVAGWGLIDWLEERQ